ncbi:MAG: hypothetical protein WBQ83_04525, partial [Candidatus Acidiferrales bacterium]
ENPSRGEDGWERERRSSLEIPAERRHEAAIMLRSQPEKRVAFVAAAAIVYDCCALAFSSWL